MQSAINKRTTIASDDITVKVGDWFKDSRVGHLYKVTDVTDVAVTLLNNNTGAVYTMPVFMLTGHGYLLSFSY